MNNLDVERLAKVALAKTMKVEASRCMDDEEDRRVFADRFAAVLADELDDAFEAELNEKDYQR